MKINFISVSFRNFLSYGNKLQTIEFKPGINLITGIDRSTGRSNGSGKCVEGSTNIDIYVEGEVKDKFLSFLND